MSYAFPRELAEQVIARWPTFVTRHDRPAPPLPSVEALHRILETAFVASFNREEGRYLRFVLCCAPGVEVPFEGGGEMVPVVPFQTPRPFTVDTIRSLAPAVSPSSAAILVRCPVESGSLGPSDGAASACEVAGVLNIGSNLARARSGRSFYHRPAPYALVIDVRDAGELHVYRSGLRLAVLRSGSLRDQLTFSGLELLPISTILGAGGDVLRPRIRPPQNEPERETADFEWTALVNTILSIVNGVKDQNHGGTVLIVAPGAEQSLPIRVKFAVGARDSVLTDQFVRFLNARHRVAEAERAIREGAARPGDGSVAHLQALAFASEQELADAADMVARLTSVDGALVLRSDLSLIGFGAEIALDAAKPVVAHEVLAGRPGDWPVVDSESFGMRHRSALRCAAVADGTAAIVISQDGAASLFWKQAGLVLIKRDINTTNPNMVGA